MRGTSHDIAKVRLSREVSFIFRAIVLLKNVLNKIINHWEVSKDTKENTLFFHKHIDYPTNLFIIFY